MSPRSTADVVARFNQAFRSHDPALLEDLVGENCVMEAIQPAPDGERTEGREACLAFWRALTEDHSTQFEPEEVVVAGERATIRWRYRYDDGPAASVRGVNLMLVREGLIVEALAYSKAAGEVPLAAQAGTTARSTREVLDRYNDAFRLHDPTLLDDVIADDCVIEDTSPAPDGMRREGGRACLARWSGLAADRALEFTPEAAEIHGDLAVQPWVLRWGNGDKDRVRGVNLIRIRDGRIVEARGYVKA
jgi:ketosteroid isomerase-like protein